MDNTIIIALISFAGTAIGSISGVLASSRLTNFRLQQLEEKVKLHNNLVERMVTVEQSCKSAHHRLDDIKEEK